jgi:hypothetical protein
MAEINYNDPRFAEIEQAKQQALSQNTETYDKMIMNADTQYQEMSQAAKNYGEEQQKFQTEQTNLTLAELEQQKQKSQKDYTREQTGAYTDYLKHTNRYGVSAERLANQGLANSGYSEASQVSMYNSYQNRYSVARESFNQTVQNFNNQYSQIKLSNNAKLAEIAFNSLQTQLQNTLQGFQYKNTLLQQKLQTQQSIDQQYYGRWQDTLAQLNQERALEEQRRQFKISQANKSSGISLEEKEKKLEKEKNGTKDFKQGKGKLTPLTFHYLNVIRSLANKGLDVKQYITDLAERGAINDTEIYYIASQLGIE